MSQASGEPLVPPPPPSSPSPTNGNDDAAASRKRCASDDTNERMFKQARPETEADDDDGSDAWQRMQDALALVRHRPELAAKVASSSGLEMASALASAGTAASELASPFNATSNTAHHQFLDVFGKYVMPHVSARDACALRCQSRALREIVDKKANVSYSQIVYALMNYELCPTVPGLVNRYLDSTVGVSPPAAEVMGICLCAVLETADADVSADVLMAVSGKLMTVMKNLREGMHGAEITIHDVATRLLFGARLSIRLDHLPFNNHEADFCFLEKMAPGRYQAIVGARVEMPKRREVPAGLHVTQVECEFSRIYMSNDDDNIRARNPSVYFPMEAVDWNPGKPLDPGKPHNPRIGEFRMSVENIIVDGLRGCGARGWRSYPRMSARLLHAVQECGFIRPLEIACPPSVTEAPFDTFLAALIVSVQRLRDVSMPYDSELAAAALLIQPAAAQFKGGLPAKRLSRTISTIASSPAAAPLVPALLQAGISFVSSESRGATLVIEAIKARNDKALHYMAPLCIIQGLDAGIQRRAVKLALSVKDDDCLRILIQNRFAIPAMCVVDEFFHTDGNPRETVRDRERHVKCISALVSNVPYWIASRVFDTTLAEMGSRLSNSNTRTPWIVTFIGDFISALWASADADEHLYDALASKDAFYNVVDAAFASHTSEKMLRIVAENSPANDSEQLSVLCGSDAMVALMKRIDELARVRQRIESVRIAASPSTDQVRLTRLLLGLSRCGWTAVKTAASGMPWFASLVRANVIDTDNLIRMLFDEGISDKYFTGGEHGTVPVVENGLLCDILNTACEKDWWAVKLATRILRWCSMLLSGSVRGATNDGISPLVQFITDSADVIVSTRGNVANTELEQLPIRDRSDGDDSAGEYPYLQEPNMSRLSCTMEKLIQFIQHTHATELGPVEQLFVVYGGDVEAMLRSLETTRDAMQPGLEPQGAARAIVTYQLASYGMDEAKTKKAVEIVRHTTVGVTLPCLPLDTDVTQLHCANDMKQLRALVRCQEPTMYFWPPPHM